MLSIQTRGNRTALRVFIMRRFIFLMMQCCVVMSASCPSDMNVDHRPRVSCVGQSLTAVPDGIEPGTQVLVLTGNLFSSLSWSSYAGFTQLHELDLSHNHITTLQPPGPVLENLSVLRLSGNRLTGLGGLVFRCAPNLTEIYLDGNQIRSLHDATFSALPRLEVIDLSRNELPALPSRLLERVSSSNMKTFDLENNSVSLMPDSFFSSKPELPYVYLSHNPWLCSCAVGYLHYYLNDQEHNVYIHEEKGKIPAADSIVCSGPPHLFQRPIVELEENDFCPPDPPLYPSGDQDFKPSISVKPNSTPETPNAPHDTTTITHLPASTKTWTLDPGSTTQSNTRNTGTPELTTSESPTTDLGIQTTDQTQTPYWIQRTAQLDPHTSRMITVQTEPPTAGPITVGAQRPSTTQPEPHTSRTTITVQTELPTTDLGIQTTDQPLTPYWIQRTAQLDPHTSRMITAQTEPPTVGPITDGAQRPSTTQPEPHTSRTTITVQTELPTTERIVPRTDPPAGVGPNWVDTRDAGGRMLPWCWWLFAGFVLLCVLSALTSCFLFLCLLRNYLTVSRRLKRHSLACSDSDGVVLRALRRTENTQGRENEGESVSFLALEQLKDVQAVFRSVLFINQREEQHGVRETNGRDASSKIELVSVAGQAQDKEREPMMSGEVFRKTLHRVISREQETDGWREEESGEGTTARYSLILREERGRQPEMQWVVGEWELGGVAYQRSCSLIGQPSTFALE